MLKWHWKSFYRKKKFFNMLISPSMGNLFIQLLSGTKCLFVCLVHFCGYFTTECHVPYLLSSWKCWGFFYSWSPRFHLFPVYMHPKYPTLPGLNCRFVASAFIYNWVNDKIIKVIILRNRPLYFTAEIRRLELSKETLTVNRVLWRHWISWPE